MPAALRSASTCGRVALGSAIVLPGKSASVLIGFEASDMIAPGAFCMIAAKALTGMPLTRFRTVLSTSPSLVITWPLATAAVPSEPGTAGLEHGVDPLVGEVALVDRREVAAELDRLDPAELMDEGVERIGHARPADKASRGDEHARERGARLEELAAVEDDGGRRRRRSVLVFLVIAVAFRLRSVA